MRVYLTLFILFALVSCSGKAPVKAKFTIDLSGITAAATGVGGLVLYGTNGKNKFTRIVSTTSGGGSIQEELLGGTWSFGAVAWNGVKAFTGDVSCAFTSSVIKAGEDATVNLKLTNDTCFDVTNNIVPAGSFNASIPKTSNNLVPSFCESEVSGRSTTQCTYSPTVRPIEKGFAGSFRFVVPGSRTLAGTKTLLKGEELLSSCYNSGTLDEPVASPTYSSTELNIPLFMSNVGFPLEVITYLDSACDDIKGTVTRSLAEPTETKFVTDGSQNILHLWTPASSLCVISSGTTNTNSPASGNGTLTSPFLICSEEQLLALQKNYNSTFGMVNAYQGVYVLGRDMNLLKFIQFGSGTSPSHQCLEMGDSFVPIGKIYDGYPSCNLNSYPPDSAFRFDGNGHTISHFRFRSSSENNVGFLSALATGAGIYDVIFDRTEIEAADYAGAVVGTATAPLIKMVQVKNSFIEGQNYTGGIAGFVNGTPSLYMLFAHKVDVEGDSQTGGLFGTINTGSLSDASFDGSVYASNGSMYVGGVVGQMSGTLLERVASKGILRGSAIKMGGIAGSAQAINFARSEMYIKDYDFNSSGTRYIGGIVGFQGASVTGKSFFNGTISSNCNSGCNIGSIAGDGGIPVDSISTFTDPGLGGQPGDDATYGIDDIYIGTAVSSAMCNGDPTCKWVQTPGAKPVLNTFEGVGLEPLCSRSPNNLSLASQAGTPHFRGSSINPLVICRPDQFKELSVVIDKYYVIEDHLNLNSLTITDMGIFDGHLDGKQNYIHSFWALSTTADASLFTVIDASSVIKNVQAVGFQLKATSCSTSCMVAPLAMYNDGELVNIRVQDVSIETLNANTQTGGMVVYNNGKIKGSRVDGDIKSFTAMGGMVYLNAGLASITESLSDVYMDAQNDASTTYVGGIAASSSGLISRSKFRGEINGLSAAVYVGGIAGISSAGSFIENEFDAEAIIRPGSTAQSVGGIVGRFSTAGTATRNLSNGTIISDSSTDIKSIVGSGTFTDTNNFRSTVPGLYIENAPSTSTYNSTTKVCTATVTGAVGNGDAIVYGILNVGNDSFHGQLADSSATYTFVTTTKDSSRCSLLNGSVNVYKELDTKDLFSIGDLKTAGWDIGDLAPPGTDEARVFATYRSWLTGNVPVNPPVWINDPDEDGLSLFLLHD